MSELQELGDLVVTDTPRPVAIGAHHTPEPRGPHHRTHLLIGPTPTRGGSSGGQPRRWITRVSAGRWRPCRRPWPPGNVTQRGVGKWSGAGRRLWAGGHRGRLGQLARLRRTQRPLWVPSAELTWLSHSLTRPVVFTDKTLSFPLTSTCRCTAAQAAPPLGRGGCGRACRPESTFCQVTRPLAGLDGRRFRIEQAEAAHSGAGTHDFDRTTRR